MTVKRKVGGQLARLGRLEETHAARLEEVRSRNWVRIDAAEKQLSPADRAAWQDAADVTERGTDPEALSRMHRACAHLPEDLPIEHPAKEGAEAWAAAALDVPEGAPLARLPVRQVGDFLTYFELCAAYCDAQAVRLPLSLDVQRLGRWGAALWRFEAALCRELGSGVGA